MRAPVRLYPRRWRERYGDEFELFLAATPPDLWTALDVVRGGEHNEFLGRWNRRYAQQRIHGGTRRQVLAPLAGGREADPAAPAR